MAQCYEHNRIDLATDAIRLLRLLSGDEGQPVRCEIFETYLHRVEGVPYEALSYVWGDTRSTDVVWVGACFLIVTSNLHEALVHLRRPDEDRVLWIDAICINQNHDAERGHQVGQMRLVYQNAQRVIVWLGASDCQIDCLFDWMGALDKQMLTIPRPHTITTWEYQWRLLVSPLGGQRPPNEVRAALSDLLQQDWFSRIWVLQEAALAKSAVITCGRREVNSRTFVVMPSLLKIDCGESVQSRLDILPGLLRAKSWWAGGSAKDLLTLLQKFGRSEASDPRDVIYALLGLSGNGTSSQTLRPNYELSLQETIQETVRHFMMESPDLPSHSIPFQLLPKWSLDKFMDSLQDFPRHIFEWATDNSQDVLLHHILSSWTEKRHAQHIQEYVSYRGHDGPPITIALRKENRALIELLLKFPSIDITSEDSIGNTPLSIAVGQGKMDVANLILERRRLQTATTDSRGVPRLEVVPEDRMCALLTAAQQGKPGRMELTLFMETTDSNGDRQLNIATRRGDERIVDLLLEALEIISDGTKILHIMLFRGSDGLTPLESAIAGGFSKIIKKLLFYERDPAQKASRGNQFEFLRKILDAQPVRANVGGIFDARMPLDLAAEVGSLSCVALLLDRGARIDPEMSPAGPLWSAASRGHLDVVRLLVQRGANIESIGFREHGVGTTPLSIAALGGHADVVMFLLKARANVHVTAGFSVLKQRQEDTVFLCMVISVGRSVAVRTLVKRGFDIDKSCRWTTDPENIDPERVCQQTWAKPLWIAASLGHTDMVSLLIQHGADIEARDSYYGMTPFQRAAEQGRSSVMAVLTEAGADTRLE